MQDVRTGLFPAPTIVAPKAWEPATRVDAAHALTTRLPYVLLVEDNPGDIRLVREAFARGPVSMQLTVAEDGLEALTMLQRAGRKPDLILLDLNLPALDGRSVLRRIKSDPGLLRIPVIVLTTSNAPQDVWSAYHLHANCYLVKPADFVEFERSLHRLIEFWAGVAHLPGG